MTFNGTATLNGNPLTLSSDVSLASSANFTCNVDLTLGANVTFNFAAEETFNGAIDVNGKTLALNASKTTVHALNGSGNISAYGLSQLHVAGSGTFSGTIANSAVALDGGSLPNAAATGGTVLGHGSIGNVTILGGLQPAGVLQTKSLAFTNTSAGTTVNLNPSGASDQVRVTGSVTLSGMLWVNFPGASPLPGQSFTIIENDGTDPMNGTFNTPPLANGAYTPLPEGSTLTTASGVKVTISYHGGDGNDVTLTGAGTKTWTGSASTSWSNPANWTPQAIPVAGEPLVFPAGATMVNDLPSGFAVGAMSFLGTATLSGNPLTLSSDVSLASSANFTCKVDLTLGANVTFNFAAEETFNGAIDVNGKTLALNAYKTTVHTLNGSGNISAYGMSQLHVAGSGTFSGTIANSAVALDGGSLPNAAATYATVVGHGSIGNVTILGGLQPAGVLQTKSLAFTNNRAGTTMTLNPGGASDQVRVTGSVTLSGMLWVNFPGASPLPGQSFTIIENDGTDPVNGTFNTPPLANEAYTPLPEGSTLKTESGVKLTISYHGGDGNDVTLTVPGTKTWTGSASTSWSNPANWTPQAVPVSGEPLVFPAGATMVNDLPSGFAVGAMSFLGTATLNGNPLTLSSDVSLASSANFTCNVDLTLGANVTFNFAAEETFNGAIDVNGKTLALNAYKTTVHALNGSGNLSAYGLSQLHVAGSGTFSGTIANSAVVLDGGSLPNAAATGGTVLGHGSIGNVTILGGLQPAGVLQTKSLAFTNNRAGTTVTLNPGGVSDQVQVTGSVTLSGVLWVNFPSALPSPGQWFTIIDNDGTDAVNGTFNTIPLANGASNALAEGSITTINGVMLAISYRGGDGNDVTLTRVVDTSTALAQSSQESLIGQPFTLTATVTALAGTPTGPVSFGDGTTTFGTATLQNGVATFTTSTVHAGVHNIVATYAGEGASLGSASGAVIHNVHRGGTVTGHGLAAGTAVYGAARFDAMTTVVAPAAGDPTGAVTITADGVDLAAGSLSGGHASIAAAALSPGVHTVTAAYGGSNDFDPSQGATTVTIAKAPTSVGVSSSHNPLPAGAPLLLNIAVPLAGPAIPSGTIKVTENGAVVAQQAISGMCVVLLHPATGHHSFVVNYSGDSNYLASSATFAQEVASPMLTADSVHVFEGDTGSKDVEIPVRLSALSNDPISVPWHTTDGTALAGVDYQQASGTVDFAPGETFHTVIVRVIGDTKKEDDKTFSVAFDAAANVQIATRSATVTIANDDEADAPPSSRHRGVRH